MPFFSKTTTASASSQRDETFTQIPFVPPRKATLETDANKQGVNFSAPSFAEPKDFVSALTEPAKVVQEKIGGFPSSCYRTSRTRNRVGGSKNN